MAIQALPLIAVALIVGGGIYYLSRNEEEEEEDVATSIPANMKVMRTAEDLQGIPAWISAFSGGAEKSPSALSITYRTGEQTFVDGTIETARQNPKMLFIMGSDAVIKSAGHPGIVSECSEDDVAVVQAGLSVDAPNVLYNNCLPTQPTVAEVRAVVQEAVAALREAGA